MNMVDIISIAICIINLIMTFAVYKAICRVEKINDMVNILLKEVTIEDE